MEISSVGWVVPVPLGTALLSLWTGGMPTKEKKKKKKSFSAQCLPHLFTGMAALCPSSPALVRVGLCSPSRGKNPWRGWNSLQPSSMLACCCSNVTNAKNNSGVAIETCRVATCEPGENCTLLRTLVFFSPSRTSTALLGCHRFLFFVVVVVPEDGRSLFHSILFFFILFYSILFYPFQLLLTWIFESMCASHLLLLLSQVFPAFHL